MRLGVYGGTFDPPHIAHLMTGEVAYRQLGLDHVKFIPAGDPWQKRSRTISPGLVRLAMVKAATSQTEYFSADDREICRGGPSYTIDTIDELLGEGHNLFLIVGADSALNIPTWKSWERLIGICQIAIVPRVGVRREDLDPAVAATAVWLDMPVISISSTDIRHRIRSAMPYRFMVPDEVRTIIQVEQLYG